MKLKLHENIKLTESEKQDSLLIIQEINTVSEYLDVTRQQDLFKESNEDLIDEYLLGICSALVQVKKDEIVWRKYIAEKYNLPVNFIYRNGDILVPEEE